MMLKGRLLLSAVGAPLVVVASPGAAQTVEQLQQQIRQLQQQLQNLQNQVDQQARQARAPAPAAPAAAAPPSGVRATLSPANRPGISSADGQNTLELTSRLHLDFADYLRVHPQTPTGQHSLTSGVNARRARIGVLGKFMGDWNYALVLDFGGSSDSNTAIGARTSDIVNAFISYVGFRLVAIDLGYMKVPWTLDEATDSNDIMFIERASPNAVATGLAAGQFRSAFGVRANSDRYWAGAYLTGPISGALHSGSNQQQLGGVARATYQLLQSSTYSLHLGLDGEYVFTPRANGSSATSIDNTVIFSDRPELRVDPTVFINSGAIPAKNAAVYGVEAAAGVGSFYAQGEYYIYQVSQSGLAAGAPTPELTFDGGYVEASYTLTGEARNYISTAGAYSAIVPNRPVGSGGWGAWELAARYSYVNLNSHVTPGVAPTATGGVFGGRQNVYTIGVNWYPVTNIRFMLDYLHADVNKIPTATGVGGSTTPGAVIQAIALRTQVAF
jgi:phosphate-selective porin OprO/OprP